MRKGEKAAIRSILSVSTGKRYAPGKARLPNQCITVTVHDFACQINIRVCT
jgi:hypothetical protein